MRSDKLTFLLVKAALVGTLALLPSLGGAVPEPRPQETLELLAAHLLEDYRAEGLPFPPEEAPLVRVSTGTTYPSDGPPKANYALGFLLGSDKDGTSRVLVGTEVASFSAASVQPAQPVAASAEGVDRWWFSAYEINAALATALQCRARGWNELADALLSVAGYAPTDGRAVPSAPRPGEQVHAGLFFEREGNSAREALWVLARAHWANELGRPDSDRAAIHRRLVALTSPERYTPEGEADLGLLRSLQAALVPSTHAPGTLEREIDDLVEISSVEDERYLRVQARGFEAIPLLMEHLDDERLTRLLKPRFNNFSPFYLRMSHLASALIEGIAGEELGRDWLRQQQGYPIERAAVEAWWARARAQGEEAWLVAHVLPPEPGAEWPNAVPLSLVAQKYPHHLPELYRRAFQSPTLQSYTIAKAITASTLPADTKRSLFLEAAKREHLEHRRAALWELRPLDEEAFVRILVETLDALPETPKGAYWNSREAAYANVVMETDDSRAWEALLRTARRVDVGLRMEFMRPMNYDYIGERQRAQRIAFLAALLDDPSVRRMSRDPQRFTGPCAGMQFPVLSVRDLAAMQLASILQLTPKGGPPDERWTPKQWEALRNDVRALQKP